MTQDIEALIKRLETEVAECERWDQPDRADLHREAAAALRAQQWQEISTAPKDGTRILAYEDGNLYALEWCQEMPGPDGGYWNCYCGQYVTITPEPTHWQPLPKAPQP